jgi:hypothetical protein
MRWLAISLLEDEFHRFRSANVNKKNPDMSILSHLYLAAEDYILTACVTFLETVKPAHLSLHFDGVRVSLVGDYSVTEICKACESHIQAATGFRVHIREKQHRTVLQAIEQKALQEPKMTTNQCQLEKHGNCIPAAIAAILGRQAFVEEAIAAESHETRPHRSYGECEGLCKVKLIPYLTFGELKDGNYLLHSEAGGNPHCVGFSLASDADACVVHDTDCVYTLSKDALDEAIHSGVDSSTCVYFRVLESDANAQEFANEELDDEDVTALLALEAAGRKRPAAALPTKTRTHNRTEGLKTRKLGVLKRPSQHEAAAPAVDSANLIASMAPTTPPAQAQFALSVHGSDSETELIQVACSDTEMESCIDLPDWLQEDGVVAVDTHLLQSLADEVASLAATAAYQKVSKGFACPCCPWRSFQSPSRVTDHLRRYHVTAVLGKSKSSASCRCTILT